VIYDVRLHYGGFNLEVQFLREQLGECTRDTVVAFAFQRMDWNQKGPLER